MNPEVGGSSSHPRILFRASSAPLWDTLLALHSIALEDGCNRPWRYLTTSIQSMSNSTLTCGLLVVSFTSLVSHSTKNDFIARMRPEYKEVPEPTLNATLSDIHDLVQYLVIEAQKIMYGEDVRKTFGVSLRLISSDQVNKLM